MGDGLYKIDNIPFYIYEISEGDVVSATQSEAEGIFDFDAVIERGDIPLTEFLFRRKP